MVAKTYSSIPNPILVKATSSGRLEFRTPLPPPQEVPINSIPKSSVPHGPVKGGTPLGQRAVKFVQGKIVAQVSNVAMKALGWLVGKLPDAERTGQNQDQPKKPNGTCEKGNSASCGIT